MEFSESPRPHSVTNRSPASHSFARLASSRAGETSGHRKEEGKSLSPTVPVTEGSLIKISPDGKVWLNSWAAASRVQKCHPGWGGLLFPPVGPARMMTFHRAEEMGGNADDNRRPALWLRGRSLPLYCLLISRLNHLQCIQDSFQVRTPP